MARYTVAHRYGARRDGQEFGPWRVGSEIDLTEADAEWINRDSPGALVAVPEPCDEPEAEVVPEPEPELAEESEAEAESADEPEPEPDAERQAKPKPNRQARKVRDRSI